jgi:hypothetical protein
MTDIVERLRKGLELCHATGKCRIMDARSGCECAEAADEIERLRAALRAPVDFTDDDLVTGDFQQLWADARKRIWRMRMGKCKCGGMLAIELDFTDGTSMEFTEPCPMCGAPRSAVES